jgi:hypothetical protein
LVEYSALTGVAETSVPFDADCAHFSETVFNNEIMTPFLDNVISDPISRLTLAVLEEPRLQQS